MLRPRKSLCTAAALAVIVVPSLSGCAGAGPPGSARAEAGVFGELFEQLKREDDEAEVHEIAELRAAADEQRELDNEREVEWR
jgi:hypothetical protein